MTPTPERGAIAGTDDYADTEGAPDDCEVLRRGELTVIGRIRSASNATFLCEAHLGERQAHCVYKPIAGRDTVVGLS